MFDVVRAAKRQRETTAQTRADAQKGVYRKGQLDQTMKTKQKTRQVKKVNVNKRTVVEHHYGLRDRFVDDQTYPADT